MTDGRRARSPIGAPEAGVAGAELGSEVEKRIGRRQAWPGATTTEARQRWAKLVVGRSSGWCECVCGVRACVEEKPPACVAGERIRRGGKKGARDPSARWEDPDGKRKRGREAAGEEMQFSRDEL